MRCLPSSRESQLRRAPTELLPDAERPSPSTADSRVPAAAVGEELAAPALAAVVLPAITLEACEGRLSEPALPEPVRKALELSLCRPE